MSATSYTFKTVGSTKIEADVFLPASTPNSKRGLLVWFHGGGLLMSNRKNIPPHLIHAAQKHDIVVVSLDYRLAPQAALPAIVEDVKDGVNWCRDELPKLIGKDIFDPTRLIVGGASAGGYLSLLSGLAITGIKPLPRAIIALYPITNPLGEFFTTSQHPVSYNKGVEILTSDMAEHIDPKSAVISGTQGAYSGPLTAQSRVHLYTYMIQEANLAHLLFMNAPEANIQDYIIAKQVTKDFPPTFMLHGDIDDKVGISQAREVAAAMRACAAELKYEEIIGGAQHGYDYAPEEQMESMYTFLKAKM